MHRRPPVNVGVKRMKRETFIAGSLDEPRTPPETLQRLLWIITLPLWKPFVQLLWDAVNNSVADLLSLVQQNGANAGTDPMQTK
jgi:hypothetical protein